MVDTLSICCNGFSIPGIHQLAGGKVRNNCKCTYPGGNNYRLYRTLSFRNKYKNEVATCLNQVASLPDSLLTEADIEHLPCAG